MFPSVGTSEYERPQPKPLVMTAHDKPASHPQQVRSLNAMLDLGSYSFSRPDVDGELKVRISIVGTNAMLISWITDDRSASTVVEYGTSPGKYNASETGYSTTYDFLSYKSGAIHNVTIAPLEPSTTYYYRCGNIGNELCLRTPPATLPIEFVIIGDVGQTGWTASTLSQISSTGSHDLLLLPGDLSYADRHQPLWDSWGRQVQPLASARPWMVTAGNHERERLREPNQPLRQFVAYDARWRMPHDESRSRSNHYYSFDAAGGVVHVVMLGSYAEFEEGSEQHEWLRRDLAAVDRRRTPWVVVLMHVPWYNTNLVHQGEGEGMRTAMERLLYEARVDVVFASHTHAYERFTRIYDNEANAQGPMYITIGDAGNSRAYEFISDHELAHLSVFREASFGHGRLRIVDETRALWTWHRNDDEYATVRDEVWLESLVSARPTVPANACISTTKL
ncbi:hypothetical protein EJB05_28315 [Eragrostis curvula]|uniref:Purple acid phosphatase n=1 Tax=Eragrostis curvula TaxID=38414 RepID=A0A5J9UQL9_9POAL|nr:hypothetical protein EJB05_28315 [Eragrostis curvula]